MASDRLGEAHELIASIRAALTAQLIDADLHARSVRIIRAARPTDSSPVDNKPAPMPETRITWATPPLKALVRQRRLNN